MSHPPLVLSKGVRVVVVVFIVISCVGLFFLLLSPALDQERLFAWWGREEGREQKNPGGVRGKGRKVQVGEEVA